MSILLTCNNTLHTGCTFPEGKEMIKVNKDIGTMRDVCLNLKGKVVILAETNFFSVVFIRCTLDVSIFLY